MTTKTPVVCGKCKRVLGYTTRVSVNVRTGIMYRSSIRCPMCSMLTLKRLKDFKPKAHVRRSGHGTNTIN